MHARPNVKDGVHVYKFLRHLKRQEKKRNSIYFIVDYCSTLVCVCVFSVVEVVKEEISEESCECGSSHALFD